ncbi:lysine-specific demethylase REF6 [Tanacetum coccineum]
MSSDTNCRILEIITQWKIDGFGLVKSYDMSFTIELLLKERTSGSVFLISLLAKRLISNIDSTFLTQSNKRTIMDDPFIGRYIKDLLKNIKTEVLLKPYTRIRIPIISKDRKGNRKEKEGLTVGEKEWHMRGVLRSKGSFIKFMEGDIAGVMSPMVYISVLFSSFVWHVEDHDFHSIKYMHTGAGKTRFTGPEGQEETRKSYVLLLLQPVVMDSAAVINCSMPISTSVSSSLPIDDCLDDVEPHRRIMDRVISEKLTKDFSELP